MTPVRRAAAAAPLLPFLAALALAGCASAPPPMTTAQAAHYYLKTMCPAEAARDADDFLAEAGTMDVAQLHAAARNAVAVDRAAAREIASPPRPWPASVHDDEGVVVRGLDQVIRGYEAVGRARTVEAVRRVRWPDRTVFPGPLPHELGLHPGSPCP